MTTRPVRKETQLSKRPVLRLSTNKATTSNTKRKQLTGPPHRMLLCNCSKHNRNGKSGNSRKPLKE
jgi:hypothetical protein